MEGRKGKSLDEVPVYSGIYHIDMYCERTIFVIQYLSLRLHF